MRWVQHLAVPAQGSEAGDNCLSAVIERGYLIKFRIFLNIY